MLCEWVNIVCGFVHMCVSGEASACHWMSFLVALFIICQDSLKLELTDSLGLFVSEPQGAAHLLLALPPLPGLQLHCTKSSLCGRCGPSLRASSPWHLPSPVMAVLKARGGEI